MQCLACVPEASSGNGRATMCLRECPGHKGGRFLCSGPASVAPSLGEGGARGLGCFGFIAVTVSFSLSVVSSDLGQG